MTGWTRAGLLTMVLSLAVLWPVNGQAAAPAIELSVVPSELKLQPSVPSSVVVRLENGDAAELKDVELEVLTPQGVTVTGQAALPGFIESGGSEVAKVAVVADFDAPSSASLQLIARARYGATPVALTHSIPYTVALPSSMTSTLTRVGSNDPDVNDIDVNLTLTVSGTEPVLGIDGEILLGEGRTLPLSGLPDELQPGQSHVQALPLMADDLTNSTVGVKVTATSLGRSIHSLTTLDGPAHANRLSLTVDNSQSFSDLSDAVVEATVTNNSNATRAVCVLLRPPAGEIDGGARLSAAVDDFDPIPESADGTDGATNSFCDHWKPYEIRPLSFRIDAGRAGGGDLPILIAAATSASCDEEGDLENVDCALDDDQRIEEIVTLSSTAFADSVAGKVGLVVAGFLPGLVAVTVGLLLWKHLVADPRKWPALTPDKLSLSSMTPTIIVVVLVSIALALMYRGIADVLIFSRFGVVDLLWVGLLGSALAALGVYVAWRWARENAPVLDNNTSAEKLLTFVRDHHQGARLRAATLADGVEGVVVWSWLGSDGVSPVVRVDPSNSADTDLRDDLPLHVEVGDLDAVVDHAVDRKVRLSYLSSASPMVVRQDGDAHVRRERSIMVYEG